MFISSPGRSMNHSVSAVLLLSRIICETRFMPTGRYNIYEVPAHPVENKHTPRSMVISSLDKSFPYSVTVVPSSLRIECTIITEGDGIILNFTS
jgi:hypothetical protein